MSTCPGCGVVFHCCMADPAPAASAGPRVLAAVSAESAAVAPVVSSPVATACWCGAMPPLMPLPAAEAAHGGCYCPDCLRTRLALRSAHA